MLRPFGEMLRRLSMEKGLSQQQLANKLHVYVYVDVERRQLIHLRYPVGGLL